MTIWINTVYYDDLWYATTHLTERGALQAGIVDMVEYVGLQSEEEITNFLEDKAICFTLDPTETELTTTSWKEDTLKQMNLCELRRVYRDWSTYVRDDPLYNIGIVETKLEA